MKNYVKNAVQPMRPYIPGENLDGVSIYNGHTPAAGDMVAVNPADPSDMWLVAKEYFVANYIEMPTIEMEMTPEHEREQCALICDVAADRATVRGWGLVTAACRELAEAIRGRGEK